MAIRNARSRRLSSRTITAAAALPAITARAAHAGAGSDSERWRSRSVDDAVRAATARLTERAQCVRADSLSKRAMRGLLELTSASVCSSNVARNCSVA